MAPSFDDNNFLFEFVVKNGNGVKGLVDSGISKVPKRYIQPLNERIEEFYSTSSQESAIDLSKLDGPDNDQLVKAISTAAEKFGFFQVVNHGVPLEILESLKVCAHGFFGQEPEAKAIYLKEVSPNSLVKYGTSFVPEKALEWKDYVSMAYTNDADALQHWPKQCKKVQSRNEVFNT
ncbi:hypothetical protein M9H77_06206 [Catharanthus roseus]|uniref:Uncharacterized protein n=1 Tax=Catharanthus roseus TaxID=4058 RepID=A0ACC0BRE0_CATRO|nr:hypothetical protein M9H77_06206 [Catharanthus roseus]